MKRGRWHADGAPSAVGIAFRRILNAILRRSGNLTMTSEREWRRD